MPFAQRDIRFARDPPEVCRPPTRPDGIREARRDRAAATRRAILRAAPGLTVDVATDVALTVLGDSTWHRLRTERGWTAEQATDWLCDALPRLLLAAPRERADVRR